MMGDAYYKGLGVPQDYVLAYMWFAIAAVYRSGEEQVEAAKMRDDAARVLTLEQLAEGQRLAREWDAERRYGDDLDFKVGR
jgi:TPR repeat protein